MGSLLLSIPLSSGIFIVDCFNYQTLIVRNKCVDNILVCLSSLALYCNFLFSSGFILKAKICVFKKK